MISPLVKRILQQPGFVVVVWLLLTIPFAIYIPLDADEAYYWLYCHFPAWGYFDHPPMIACQFISYG
ncbi:MAG: hypothetical protein D4R67_03720 [Bacteroidetes bacterium]|nr:MAG: hypothetical protein D4R67_03720 [Bacteroidota bacterium]